jgi:hypothetical protein
MQAYKIQIMSVNGWSDLKYSCDETKEYVVETFKTKQEAIKEMNSIISDLEDDPDNYRVVNYLVQEEADLY